jgi:hypothetical protein
MGPKPLITPAVQEQLLEARRRGLSLMKSAQWAGISYDTLHRWQVRGREASQVAAGKRSSFDGKCVDLCRVLDKVDAEWLMRCETVLALSMTPGQNNDAWRMASTEEKALAVRTAMWKLSHQAPEDYSTQIRTELTGADGGPIDAALSLEDVWEIMADARRAEKEGGDDDE